MKYLIVMWLLFIVMAGCSSYVKKSTFDNYKSLHSIEHLDLLNNIQFNEDKIDSNKFTTDNKFKSVEQEINDLMLPSCIFYLSPDNFEVHFGTFGAKVIKLK